MCSYTITSRYQVARLAVRSRLPLSSVILIARSQYEPTKVKSRRPASPCEIIARRQYESVRENSDFTQIALVDGDGSFLLDNLGNILIIGYCHAPTV